MGKSSRPAKPTPAVRSKSRRPNGSAKRRASASRSASKPHQFGQFNVKGLKVVNWRLPDNADDDVQWGYERLSDKRRHG